MFAFVIVSVSSNLREAVVVRTNIESGFVRVTQHTVERARVIGIHDAHLGGMCVGV